MVRGKPDLPVLPTVPVRQRIRLVASAVFIVPFMIVFGCLMVAEGGGVLLPFAGAGFVLCGVASVGYLVRFLMTPRGAQEAVLRAGATVLPESQVARWLAWVSVGSALLSIAVLVLAVLLHSPMRVPGVGLVGALVTLSLAVPTVVGVLRGKRPRGALVLTPDIIRLRTWSSEREVAWDDVVEVVALREPRRTLVVCAGLAGQVRVLRAPAAWGERPRHPQFLGDDRALAISFPHLTGDPAVLLAALDHWRRVRRDRVELGTEASLRRLDPGAP